MLKRIIAIMLMGVMISCMLAGCGVVSTKNNQTEKSINTDNISNGAAKTAQKDTSDKKILIAYFSVPENVTTEGIDANAGASIVVRNNNVLGNMQYMAMTIQEAVGGELFRIETTEQYPLEHSALVDKAKLEQNKDVRPELATHIDNLNQYDTIFLGYPKMEQGYICV